MRYKITLHSLLAGLLLSTATVSAQPEISERPATVGGFVGGLAISSADDSDAVGAETGFRLGYMPSRVIGVEAEGEVAPLITASGWGGAVWGLRAHVVAQLPVAGTPFALAGLGGSVRQSGRDASDGLELVGYVGVGATHRLSSFWSVRGDLRLVSAAGDDVRGEALFGFSYRFDPRTPARAAASVTITRSIDAAREGRARRAPAPARRRAEETDLHADSDHDGISDSHDECPRRAEDLDGTDDEDGCPDPDNDGDHVADAIDACPNVAGVLENLGCPDRDADGVADPVDNCPTSPGKVLNYGCWEKQLVVLDEGQVVALHAPLFKTSRARVRRRTWPTLDNLAHVLIAHPELSEIEVIGHADETGNPDFNQRLSLMRAERVVEYLVKRKVLRERLSAVGLGASVPAVEGSSSTALERNRRVEFRVVRREPMVATRARVDRDGSARPARRWVDPDSDNDGILDGADACPLAIGSAENRGCPDADSDGDGLVGRVDNCPDESGDTENRGCSTEQVVLLSARRLEMSDDVLFERRREALRASSKRHLDNVARVLNAHPEITRVEIADHTNDAGDHELDKELSRRRAKVVRDYLIARGVASERLVSVGYGPTVEVANFTSRQAPARDPRVEFVVLERTARVR